MAENEAALRSASLVQAVNTSWLIQMASLAFFMQAGFTMLEVGVVRAKNARNIILKNVFDTCVASLAFALIGFGAGFGCDEEDTSDCSPFIGTKYYAIVDYPQSKFPIFFFQLIFCVTATTIASGAMAERTHLSTYLLHSCVNSVLIYPLPARWIWGPEGWLRTLGENGVLDFAGSGVVHMSGGMIGLVGAIVLGPRTGRYDSNGMVTSDYAGHSIPLSSLGTFILWYGWYGFNVGSTSIITDGLAETASLVLVTTTLAASAGGAAVLVYDKMVFKSYDLNRALNGILAGLVSITAGCAYVSPWISVVIGLIGGFCYIGLAALLTRFCVDDPLEAAPVHLGGGLWGMIAVGLFAKKAQVQVLRGGDPTVYGLFYGGGAELLGVQLCGAIVILAWATFWAYLIFRSLDYYGMLRVSHDVEITGIDNSLHGGPAYGDFVLQQ
eukprot:GFYU01010598.1.p1 GENE.GFYU01010598.1~~GFYU01010598.1.p1  ORF type:complete len:440 (-),score=43.84 GFYU01010598.1:160-1479(-)